MVIVTVDEFPDPEYKQQLTRLKNCAESRRAISVIGPRTDTINDEVPCVIFVGF